MNRLGKKALAILGGAILLRLAWSVAVIVQYGIPTSQDQKRSCQET